MATKYALAAAILTVFLSLSVHSAVFITEIMYDPLGPDSNHEWIEVYSSSPENISGWVFYEAGTDHRLTLDNGSWVIDGYVVIADNLKEFRSDYPGFNGTLFDSSWGALHNKGEYLALKNSSSDFVDEVNYSDSWGGSSGYSLELNSLSADNAMGIYWNTSLMENGTPGRENSVFSSCTASLVNTSWSDWVNQTGCLANDTYLQNRSRTQYDENACGTTINTTFWETQALSCDYCVPAWSWVNTSCQDDDSIVQWHNDTDSCYDQTALDSDLAGREANETFSLACDYNGDNIIGTVSHINTTLTNLSIITSGNITSLYDQPSLLAEFSLSGTLLLTDVFVEKQAEGSAAGYLILRGIAPLNQTKTVYVDNLDPSITTVCVDDSSITSLSNISSECSEDNETLLTCDGVEQDGYTCTENGTQYRITGLSHSGVVEMAPPPAEAGLSFGGRSGGGRQQAETTCPEGMVLRKGYCAPLVDGPSFAPALPAPAGETIAGTATSPLRSSARIRQQESPPRASSSIRGSPTAAATAEIPGTAKNQGISMHTLFRHKSSLAVVAILLAASIAALGIQRRKRPRKHLP